LSQNQLGTPEYAELTAATVMGAAGSPLPAFVGGMWEARHWASYAIRSELKTHALAAFKAMNAKNQAAFLKHISNTEVAACRCLSTERPLSGTPLPFDLEAVKVRLQAEGDAENDAITIIGTTAASEIEPFAQIALLEQSVRVTIFEPTQEAGLALPIGTVEIDNRPTVSIDGVAFTAFDFAGGWHPIPPPPFSASGAAMANPLSRRALPWAV